MAIALLCCGAKALALTFDEVEMVCPYDGTKFTFTAEASGTSFGRTLDLRPLGPIMSPWPMAVCPTNGFVFFKDKFDDEELKQLKPLILSPAYQALAKETAYYRAAWIRERTGASHEDVSFLLLQATWQADRGGQYERYAKQLIERLPDDIRAAKCDKKPVLQQVLGELMRRVGNFDAAKAHFLEWKSELAPGGEPSRIAAFELGLIEAKDSGPHATSEALDPKPSK